MYDLHILEQTQSANHDGPSPYWHWLFPPNFFLVHQLNPIYSAIFPRPSTADIFAAFRYDTDYRRVSIQYDLPIDTSMTLPQTETEEIFNFEEIYEKVANENQSESLLLLEPLMLIRKMEIDGFRNELMERAVLYEQNAPSTKMTISDHRRVMRLAIGYTLAFLLLISLTFYTIYYV